MAQITPNTQIDTINVLQEANSVNNTDLLFIQRGAVSHKVKKENLIIPSNQISPIANLRVLGNVSGSSNAPSEITVLDSNDPDSNLDTALVTEKRIKDYITSQSTQQSINKKFKVNTSRFTVSPSGWITIPQFSFTGENFASGDILVLFSMSNRRRWGGRWYRMLFNGNVIAERRYTYIGSAYEIDWTFDIVAPITIPSDGSYDLLIQANGWAHEVDIGCSICVMNY